LAGQRKVDVGLTVLLFLQWLLVGAFPLGKLEKWWADPAVFISGCTIVGTFCALIPPIEEAARLLAAFAVVGWLYWFGLLVWTTLRFGWRQFVGLRTAQSH
jgi:hypothetical protein